MDATLRDCGPLRYTPAGIPAFDGVLLHASEQDEAGAPRRVECELAAVAFGPVARELAGLTPGTALRCTGFLARRHRRGTSVALHVHQFEVLDRD
jgi:primosomal replication protein N